MKVHSPFTLFISHAVGCISYPSVSYKPFQPLLINKISAVYSLSGGKWYYFSRIKRI